MVTLPRQILLVAVALLSVLFLCQCETQRTYGEVRRGAISFDNAAWGGQGNSDESAITVQNLSVQDGGRAIVGNLTQHASLLVADANSVAKQAESR